MCVSARRRRRCRPGLPTGPAMSVPSASPPLHGPERARPPPFDPISGDPILRVETRSLAAPARRDSGWPRGSSRCARSRAAGPRPRRRAGRQVPRRGRNGRPGLRRLRAVGLTGPAVRRSARDGLRKNRSRAGRSATEPGPTSRPAAASVERAPSGAFAEREISPISGARRAGAAYGRDDAKWAAAGEALLQRLDRRACDAGPVPAGGDARAGVQEPGVALERGTGMAFRRGRWCAPASPQPPFAAAAATLPATGTGPKRRRDRQDLSTWIGGERPVSVKVLQRVPATYDGRDSEFALVHARFRAGGRVTRTGPSGDPRVYGAPRDTGTSGVQRRPGAGKGRRRCLVEVRGGAGPDIPAPAKIVGRRETCPRQAVVTSGPHRTERVTRLPGGHEQREQHAWGARPRRVAMTRAPAAAAPQGAHAGGGRQAGAWPSHVVPPSSRGEHSGHPGCGRRRGGAAGCLIACARTDPRPSCRGRRGKPAAAGPIARRRPPGRAVGPVPVR